MSKPSKVKVPRASASSFGIIRHGETIPHASPVSSFLQLENNVRSYSFNKIQGQSLETYQTGWNHFQRYTARNGFDLNLSTLPGYLLGVELTIPFMVSAFCGFIIHCVQDLGTKPSTAISNYGPAALFFLENGLNVDVSSIKQSPTFRACKAGLTLEECLKNPQWKKDTLPFTVESILFAKQHIYNDPTNAVHTAIILNMEFQFTTLARISECILHPSAERHHHVCSEEVQFLIRSKADPSTSSIYVSSHEVTSSLTNHYIVIDVIISRTSTKADCAGAGNNFSFSSAIKPTAAFNLPEDMFHWAARAQLQKGNPFFSWRQSWCLSYNQANAAVKETMRQQGFGENIHQFSTHSLRIGGASTLAAAGYSDSIIQKMGGWKSVCFLRYIRLAVEAFGKCHDALTNATLLTNDHLMRMLPGFNASTPQAIASTSSSSRKRTEVTVETSSPRQIRQRQGTL